MPRSPKPTAHQRSFAALALIALAAIFSVSTAHAQLPSTRLTTVFPPGAKAGGEAEVVVSGVNFENVSRLAFSHPGITATQKTAEPGPFEKGPQPVPNTFLIKVAANVPAGLHEVRAVGKYGASNPRAFQVGALTEALEVDPNNHVTEATELKLGTIITGRSNAAADVDVFKFSATAGQRVLVDCWARRIDSQLDAVMHVRDIRGRELGSSRDSERRDPLIDFTAPATGEYFITLHDALYRGGVDYFYRLAVGTFPHVDFVFPPAGNAGARTQFTLFGRNLPGGQPAGITLDGRPLQKVTVAITLPSGAAATNLVPDTFIEPCATSLDAIQYRVTSPLGTSQPVMIGIATAPVVIETEPNESPEKAVKLSPPCEYIGRFYPRGDQDWVSFTAKKDDVYTIEVISHRLGLPTDPSLVVQQITMSEMGERQVKVLQVVDDSTLGFNGANFDTRSDDPVYRFVAPADGLYEVLVRDAISALQDQPRNMYRLAIRKPAPDFRLVAIPENSLNGLLVRKGGRTTVRVLAFRRDGYDGDITVTVTGLPAGVTSTGAVIGGGRSSASLVLSAAANATPTIASLRISGKGTIGTAAVTRTARYGTTTRLAPPPARNQPSRPENGRLSRSLALTVSDTETAPLALSGGVPKVYEISRAGILKIPFTLARAGNNVKVDSDAIDLPANVTATKPAFNPGVTTATLQLTLKNNTPTGIYTIFLRGRGPVPYSRNPEAATVAAARKVELDKIVVDLTAKSKAATAAKVITDKAAIDTANLVKTATTTKAATDKATIAATTAAKVMVDKQTASAKVLATAQAELKSATAVKVAADKTTVDAAAKAKLATTNATNAKAAATKAPGNAALTTAATAAVNASTAATQVATTATAAATVAAKTLVDTTTKTKTATAAKTAADKAVTDANAKVVVATKAATDALKTLDDANVKAKTAVENKEKSDKVAIDATDILKLGTVEQAKVVKRATDTANTAKPKNVNVFAPSTPVTIKITPAPITLKATAPTVPLKQGAKFELPVAVTRLYAFADAVTISVALPQGVTGLQIPNATIAKGQVQGKLALTAAANATPGQHELKIRAAIRLNNQPITIEQSVLLTVLKVEPPKTPAKK
jgi:hypothetical protein